MDAEREALLGCDVFVASQEGARKRQLPKVEEEPQIWSPATAAAL